MTRAVLKPWDIKSNISSNRIIGQIFCDSWQDKFHKKSYHYCIFSDVHVMGKVDFLNIYFANYKMIFCWILNIDILYIQNIRNIFVIIDYFGSAIFKILKHNIPRLYKDVTLYKHKFTPIEYNKTGHTVCKYINFGDVIYLQIFSWYSVA